MGMTLEEAIKHCEEVAEKNEEECKNWAYGASQINDDENRKKQYQKHAEMWHECAKKHRQLAEWLRELKAYRNSPVLQRWLKQCDTCKHESKRASEAPCKSCCHTFKNKHEEVNDDAKTEDT